MTHVDLRDCPSRGPIFYLRIMKKRLGMRASPLPRSPWTGAVGGSVRAGILVITREMVEIAHLLNRPYRCSGLRGQD